MSSSRFFSGSRETTKKSSHQRVKEFKKQQENKHLSSSDRYKQYMQERLDAHKEKAMMTSSYSRFTLPGAKTQDYELSDKAQQALKEMAKKKAAKVSRSGIGTQIKPQYFGSSGRIDKKGRVYDHLSQQVLYVDPKKGRVRTMMGLTLGKYKPNKAGFNSRMEGWIKQNSPYYIKLQKMQQEQFLKKMYGNEELSVIDVHGNGRKTASSVYSSIDDSNDYDIYGNRVGGSLAQRTEDSRRARQKLGVTAFGVNSNNVFGSFAQNIWGTEAADNVWGSAHSNIWGGMGDTDAFTGGAGGGFMKVWSGGNGAQKVWGSGNGKPLNMRKLGKGMYKVGKAAYKAVQARMRARAARARMVNR